MTKMPDRPVSVVWFRNDLRLADNPALDAAVKSGLPVIPVFIQEEGEGGAWPCGGASKWWLHHSLGRLSESLAKAGSKLLLKKGSASRVMQSLTEEYDVSAVFWNRRYTPQEIKTDKSIKQLLGGEGVTVKSFNAALLWEPWQIETRNGTPYNVFTPFWKTILARGAPDAPLPAPEVLMSPDRWPASDNLDNWGFLPRHPDWASGLRENWQPGEAGAWSRLEEFLDAAIVQYETARNIPAAPGTSKLSPHLHFGEISPRQIWQKVQRSMDEDPSIGSGCMAWLREIGWREFCFSLLYYNPELPDKNLKAEFDKFQWRDDSAGLTAWQKGLTGFPIVDAGMRELWQTGWMHNRVRMIVASFLIKDLLVNWRHGEAWFRDTLVDADLANNAAGWQWVAGSGADASPFFRIFNPVLQGQKFDDNGAYVRRWIPELKRLPDKYIHIPHMAPDDVLAAAGVTLGETYPWPIVDHSVARDRALGAYKDIRKS